MDDGFIHERAGAWRQMVFCSGTSHSLAFTVLVRAFSARRTHQAFLPTTGLDTLGDDYLLVLAFCLGFISTHLRSGHSRRNSLYSSGRVDAGQATRAWRYLLLSGCLAVNSHAAARAALPTPCDVLALADIIGTQCGETTVIVTHIFFDN